MFSDNKEPAFAALKMCQAVGAFSIFITGPYLCTKAKILIVGGFLILAMSGYIGMEIYTRKQRQNETCIGEPIQVKKVPKGPASL